MLHLLLAPVIYNEKKILVLQKTEAIHVSHDLFADDDDLLCHCDNHLNATGKSKPGSVVLRVI